MSTGKEHRFEGNPEDLQQFDQLVRSPMRSPERQQALEGWAKYKLGRQAAHVRRSEAELTGKQGLWTKGDYVKSLTAPAIDLRGATLTDVCVGYADLRGVRLDDAVFDNDMLAWTALKGARLERASLQRAELVGARLMGADLREADLRGADLRDADLSDAVLIGADLRGAILQGASLERASLVGARLDGTNLRGCRVYGVSAWDVSLCKRDELRRDLIVTPAGQPEVTVDNIEVAQFVYLLLNNPRIRGVIDTVCRKGVLILGRFSDERKAVLDALRDELRARDFVPMIFDFDKPSERDLTETVKTLAGLCRFIIADITAPKSSPLELQATVPDYMIPFVPIIEQGEQPFAMFADLWQKYRWVLEPLEYAATDELIAVIEPAIIRPALDKHAELLAARATTVRTRKAADYRGE